MSYPVGMQGAFMGTFIITILVMNLNMIFLGIQWVGY